MFLEALYTRFAKGSNILANEIRPCARGCKVVGSISLRSARARKDLVTPSLRLLNANFLDTFPDYVESDAREILAHSSQIEEIRQLRKNGGDLEKHFAWQASQDHEVCWQWRHAVCVTLEQ